MIDLYYWTTSNGNKVLLFLEEAGVPYRIVPIDISKGEQFSEAFTEISPNNRIPAIVDHPDDGGPPMTLFESCAILFYLANKTGMFVGKSERQRTEALKWLFWQAAGLGPAIGNYYHFNVYAMEKHEYAIRRFDNEVDRLLGVLDSRLGSHTFIADDYSVADIACFPWIRSYVRQGHAIGAFPNLQRWFDAIQARPAVERTYQLADEVNVRPAVTADSRMILFGQTSRRSEG